MTIALKFIINCEILGLEESFNGICLVMHFQKCGNMILMKRRYAKILGLSQSNLCNLKFGRARQEWTKAYIDFRIRQRKLNTLVKIR